MDLSAFLRNTGKRFFFASGKDTKPAFAADWNGLAASDAIALSREAVVSLGRQAYDLFETAGKVLFLSETQLMEDTRRRQSQFQTEAVRLTEKLDSLRLLDLTGKELRQTAELLWVTAQVRRVGLYAGDVAESAGELGKRELSPEGKKELEQYFKTTLLMLHKALLIYQGRSFDQLRSLHLLEEQAEEQLLVLKDGYFQRIADECCEPGIVFPSVAADCARCCELAGEIACVITGRERL